MNFNDLTECPFCGNDEFYTKDYIQGPTWYNQRFDGLDAHNENMYDCLHHTTGKRAYCNNCDSYLGELESGKLAKKVIDKLSGQDGAENG